MARILMDPGSGRWFLNDRYGDRYELRITGMKDHPIETILIQRYRPTESDGQSSLEFDNASTELDRGSSNRV